MPATNRTSGSDRSLLRLGGIDCGFLESVDGGAITADVIREPPGAQSFIKKHIGLAKYGEFAVKMDFSMEKAVYDWIRASWAGTPIRKDGTIVRFDQKMLPQRQVEFSGALITETTLPSCDASSKGPDYLTLKFAPASIRVVHETRERSKGFAATKRTSQRRWLSSSYRLEIDGLDSARVAKVDSFTVSGGLGTGGQHASTGNPVDFPNLRVTLAESAARTWVEWYEDFVIGRNNDEKHERNGSLMFLGPNGQSLLGRVNFHNLGIFGLAAEASQASTDRIARLVADLYCQHMEFVFGA